MIWRRLRIPANHPHYFFQFFTVEGEHTLPLGPHEHELKGESAQQRIDYLQRFSLIFIEKRADSESKLFKDSVDGRFWQLSGGVGQAKLTQVNLSQWQYEYVERRDNPHHADADQEFYLSLEEDSLQKPCSEKDCPHHRVRFSEFCRDHHFALVRGHTYR